LEVGCGFRIADQSVPHLAISKIARLIGTALTEVAGAERIAVDLSPPYVDVDRIGSV
jgi:hypothetical protein